MSRASHGEPELAVYYNGSCPICRAEIEHYRRQPGAAIRWLDVAADAAAGRRVGLVGETGFRRLHAVTGEGPLLAGLDAFLAIWETIPRYRRLARLVRLPVVRRLAEPLYERVMAPLLYALHRRRQRRARAA